MNLYVVRHGYADNTSPDSQRALTDEGRQKLIKMIPQWKSYIPKIDIIFTSPYKRAYQTAQVIHKGFNVKEKLLEDNELQPGFISSNFIATLSSLEYKDIMIVGHMPDVSDLVAELTSPMSFGFPFAPGTLAAIEFEGRVRIGAGKLKLFLPEGK
ncbi:MAG: phosphohistidine phosphatase SixA [Melioribacteraceae bacterium]|nr:MAG: phosphohistidine phosphatase SixA [Melioribacteraceae bacterium]